MEAKGLRRLKVGGALLVAVSSAALYGLLRVKGLPDTIPTFSGACARIRSSGMPFLPGDVWCRTPLWHYHAYTMWAALMLGLGYGIACAVLAATGRKASALIPALVAPFSIFYLGGSVFYWWGGDGAPLSHQIVAAAIDLFVISLPAAAVALVVAPRSYPRVNVSLGKRLLAALVCCAATIPVLLLTELALSHHGGGFSPLLAVSGLMSGDTGWWGSLASGSARFGVTGGILLFLLGPCVAMAAFGALLGPNRRWWPWSLVLVAIFLSQAPSEVPILIPSNPLGYWWLAGLVVPLSIVGAIWSAWRPLAMRFARSRVLVEDGTKVPRHTRLRPTVVLNTIAVCVVVSAAMMFLTDPFGIDMTAALPTYLGTRLLAQDVRASMDLVQALSDMKAYRTAHGTYSGFTANVAAAADPSLSWHQGALSAHIKGAHLAGVTNGNLQPNPPKGYSGPWPPWPPEQTVGVVTATATTARVMVQSYSGTFYCMQQSPTSGTTFGSAGTGGWSPAQYNSWAKQVVQSCGSAPWNNSLLAPPPPLDCVAGDDGYLICRMVQVLVHNMMVSPKPSG